MHESMYDFCKPILSSTDDEGTECEEEVCNKSVPQKRVLRKVAR